MRLVQRRCARCRAATRAGSASAGARRIWCRVTPPRRLPRARGCAPAAPAKCAAYACARTTKPASCTALLRSCTSAVLRWCAATCTRSTTCRPMARVLCQAAAPTRRPFSRGTTVPRRPRARAAQSSARRWARRQLWTPALALLQRIALCASTLQGRPPPASRSAPRPRVAQTQRAEARPVTRAA